MIVISVPKKEVINEDPDYYVWWQAGNDFGDKHVLDYPELIRSYTHPPFAAFVYRMTLSQPPLKTSALVFSPELHCLLPLAIYLIYKILL